MLGRLIPLAIDTAAKKCAAGETAAVKNAAVKLNTAAWNMAVDQALLESVDQTQVPVLRFYQWPQPTLSLGYFQQLADRKLHSASGDAICVRRSTGGGAILHHRELTYSFAIPIPVSATGARKSLYRDTHQAISQALSDFGVRAVPHRLDQGWTGKEDAFLCFQRRTDEDLVTSGYKVLGSAQRKTKRAMLQHGSLLLKASPLAPELPGVWDLGGSQASDQQVAAAVSERLIQVLQSHQNDGANKISWANSSLSEQETGRAVAVQRDRFASASWTSRR